MIQLLEYNIPTVPKIGVDGVKRTSVENEFEIEMYDEAKILTVAFDQYPFLSVMVDDEKPKKKYYFRVLLSSCAINKEKAKKMKFIGSFFIAGSSYRIQGSSGLWHMFLLDKQA